jgi:hypothetical protein
MIQSNDNHREPWEIISLITAAYLGLYVLDLCFLLLEYAAFAARNKSIFMENITVALFL